MDIFSLDFVNVSNLLIIVYFLLLNSAYLGLVIISFFYIREQYKTLGLHQFPHIFESDLYRSASIIVPAYNEEKDIINTVRSLLQLQFNNFEVIVVNDGSTDRTLDLLKEEYNLFKTDRHVLETLNHKPIRQIYASHDHPNLLVIDKENGQKADALNAGINAARKDLFCTIDADSWLERDVLVKLMRSFSEDADTIAVGGIVRIANGCKIVNGEMKEVRTPPTMIGCIQVVEYIRAFLLGRTGWEYFDGLLIISGAFGIFDRNAVLNVGGFHTEAVGEDFEMVVKLHKYYIEHDLPYKITYQPEPVCWTYVPTDWAGLSSQRNRWQRALAQTLWLHKDMLFRRKYGVIGIFVMPFYFIFELVGAVIEVIGYGLILTLLLSGLLPPMGALLFFIAAVLLGMVLSLASLLCDELTYKQYPREKDVAKLIFFSFFESFGYRQLHTWWRFRGILDYFAGNLKWEAMHRNRKVKNALYWFGFIAVDIFIIALVWYGLTDGDMFF